jgi:serine/threonine protein kinase
VSYYNSVVVDDHINIVLEYVENGSLLALMKTFSSTLPEPLIVRYIAQVLKGLAYLHAMDILHGDLKAANILVTKDGKVFTFLKQCID